MNPSIIFEDESMVVINKPAGMVSNIADTVDGPTVQDWVKSTFAHELAKNDAQRNGLVHRLDKDTSGILLVAKTASSLIHLKAQFKDRLVNKTYTALVHGKLSPLKGQISLPLGRSNLDRKKFTVSTEGKLSKTAYQVETYYSSLIPNTLRSKSYQGFSLVSLYPKTGRTHQLRVVLTHLGHPIVGDSKYTGKKRSRADKKWCSRQFLHASAIEFSHPLTKQSVSFTAPLAKDLIKILKLLETHV